MGRTVLDDTTVEALLTILESNPRGVLVAKDELAGWVRSMDQYKSGKGSDRQVWLSLWSNAPVTVDRKGRGEPIMLLRPFVSVAGSIQPDVLPELVSGREDGLLDRFLFAYPEPHRAYISDNQVSAEVVEGVKRLYDDLANLEIPEDDYGEPYPRAVPLSSDAWEVFKELTNELQDEAHAPGFPTRLEGVWSKMEAYLARLALILALCRVVEQGGEERVETKDLLAASVLLSYFKVHARRVHLGLHSHAPEDLLAVELARFLQDKGGDWKDEPSVLHEELMARGAEALPERPDELSKMVYALSSRGTWLRAEQCWKKKDGKSRRAIRLRFRNGVDGVVGVDPAT